MQSSATATPTRGATTATVREVRPGFTHVADERTGRAALRRINGALLALCPRDRAVNWRRDGNDLFC